MLGSAMQWTLFTSGGYDVTDLEDQNNNIQISDSSFFFPPSFHSVLKSNKNIKQGARAFSCEKDWQAASVKLHISLYFDALGKIIF